MPRFRAGERAEFFAVELAARDLGDATLLTDYLSANESRMPAWAVDMLNRTVHNIEVATAGQQAIERDETTDVLPSDVTDVYSLVTITQRDEITGEVTGEIYRTVKRTMEQGDTIDDVLSDIEIVLEKWNENYQTAPEDIQVTPLWQVHTEETERTFPLQGR